MKWLRGLGHAFAIAGSMTWQILWALIFGFLLSAVIQAVVRRETIVKRLGDDRTRTLAIATGLGMASSSCSYAAVALARSLFKKGSSFTAAMVFEIASTNLVVELGVILAVLIGWQFTAAEFVGGPIMIVLIALIFRLILRKRMIDDARTQANRNFAGSMEGHAAMDMSINEEGSLISRLRSKKAINSISHIFVMEWVAVIRDIVLGLLIAGAIAAWVPNSFWGHFFAKGHPLLSKVWGPIVGPVVSLLSFVCSIGNVPLAGVLWNGGISFGGVVSFLFADLIILPILLIYKKYYGKDDSLHYGKFLLHHGDRRLPRRDYLQSLWIGPKRAARQGWRDCHSVELHERIEHHCVNRGRGFGNPIRSDRRNGNDEDDGRTTCGR